MCDLRPGRLALAAAVVLGTLDQAAAALFVPGGTASAVVSGRLDPSDFPAGTTGDVERLSVELMSPASTDIELSIFLPQNGLLPDGTTDPGTAITSSIGAMASGMGTTFFSPLNPFAIGSGFDVLVQVVKGDPSVGLEITTLSVTLSTASTDPTGMMPGPGAKLDLLSAAVPLPASAFLILGGLGALALVARRRG